MDEKAVGFGGPVDAFGVVPQDSVVHILGTVGMDCRQLFTRELLDLLDRRSVPAALRVRWTSLVQHLLT